MVVAVVCFCIEVPGVRPDDIRLAISAYNLTIKELQQSSLRLKHNMVEKALRVSISLQKSSEQKNHAPNQLCNLFWQLLNRSISPDVLLTWHLRCEPFLNFNSRQANQYRDQMQIFEKLYPPKDDQPQQSQNNGSQMNTLSNILLQKQPNPKIEADSAMVQCRNGPKNPSEKGTIEKLISFYNEAMERMSS